jgi:hypothetical protein
VETTKEYVLNCGTFNIIVAPARRQYYVLGTDELSAAALAQFMSGKELDVPLQPHWFRYAKDETWTGFDGRQRSLGTDVSEAEIIEYFVLKKFNFGSLIAAREMPQGRLQVFKRHKLTAAGAV